MIVWILLALCVAYAVWRLFLGYAKPSGPHRLLARREAAFLEAAAEAMFPPGGAIPLSGRDADLPGYAEAFLVSLPAQLRLQVRAMFMLFEQATIFFPAKGWGGFRRFSSLAPEQQVEVLESWSQSRFFLRRLAFTALRAVLTMGYLGHPIAMRSVRLAPYDLLSPVCEGDLLYPRIGAHPDSIRFTETDLSQSDGTPLDLDGPVHPDYAGDTR
ncbi:MAG: hypothetical protein VCC20_04400 [Myxococcota bacterium]